MKRDAFFLFTFIRVIPNMYIKAVHHRPTAKRHWMAFRWWPTVARDGVLAGLFVLLKSIKNEDIIKLNIHVYESEDEYKGGEYPVLRYFYLSAT